MNELGILDTSVEEVEVLSLALWYHRRQGRREKNAWQTGEELFGNIR